MRVCRSSTSRFNWATSSRRLTITSRVGWRTPSSMDSSSPRSTDSGVRNSCEIWAIQVRLAFSSASSAMAMAFTSVINSSISTAAEPPSPTGMRTALSPFEIFRVASCNSRSGRLQRPATHHPISPVKTSVARVIAIRPLYWRSRNRASSPAGSGSAVSSTLAISRPSTLTARIVTRAPGGWGRPAICCPCISRTTTRSARPPGGAGAGRGGGGLLPSCPMGGGGRRPLGGRPLNSSIKSRVAPGSSVSQPMPRAAEARRSTNCTNRMSCSSSRWRVYSPKPLRRFHSVSEPTARTASITAPVSSKES